MADTVNLVGEIGKSNIPKPLLKWVGGKGQIIDKVLGRFPHTINGYHDVFMGGGSVLMGLLWLQREGKITINGSIHAYDLNPSLIGFYQNVKHKPGELFKAVEEIAKVYVSLGEDGTKNHSPATLEEGQGSRESYYYWIRSQFNKETDKTLVVSSAYFLFLNKTGFRGMYREGPNGFNIPYGHPKNPVILDEDALEQTSANIQDVIFTCCTFQDSFETIREGGGQNHMVYLDPPYAPEDGNSFVGYTKSGFPLEQHQELFVQTMDISGTHHVMMSNADVPLVREHLTESEDAYTYEVVSCRRAINSKNPGARTNEVILTSYTTITKESAP